MNHEAYSVEFLCENIEIQNQGHQVNARESRLL